VNTTYYTYNANIVLVV